MKSTTALTIAALVLSGTIASAGSTPEQKCEGGKNLTAGKYLACRAKAQKRRAVTGDSARYLADVDKCDAKFTAKWQKLELLAEAQGTRCPSVGDESEAMEAAALCLGTIDWISSGKPRFEDNGDGTITDNKQKVMFEKKILQDGMPSADVHDADNEYSWAGVCGPGPKHCQPTTAAADACAASAGADTDGCDTCGGGEGACSVSTTVFTWLVQLNASNFAGHSDWRIPHFHRLTDLIDPVDVVAPLVYSPFHGANCGVTCADIDDPACSCASGSPVATATTSNGDDQYYSTVSFYSGSTSGTPKTAPWSSIRAYRPLP